MEYINTLAKLENKSIFIAYEIKDDITEITWGKCTIAISNEIYRFILEKFFIDKNEWYHLGLSITNTVPGGLGEFIKKHC